MVMTSMKSVMLEEEGKRAGAETNIPAEVADKSKKKPPARLEDFVFFASTTSTECRSLIDSVVISFGVTAKTTISAAAGPRASQTYAHPSPPERK